MSYRSYTFFYVGRYDSIWVIQQKTENNLWPFFRPEMCLWKCQHMLYSKRHRLSLMKVNVSAHIWQMLQLKFSYHTHTGNMLSCHLLDVRNSVLINCDYFCVDGFLHSKSENSILASASDLRISTNLPRLFTSNSIHIQPFHPVYI